MTGTMAAVTFTIRNALIACDVEDVALYDGVTAAAWLANDIFDNDFNACMDKTYEDLDDNLKAYSTMTVANGHIRLNPSTKKLIKAFIQWSRDQICLGHDPTLTAFPPGDSVALLRRYKTHDKFTKKASTMSDTAKPENFTAKVKWEDWAPSFLNFLRVIPGRDGVPIKYICRDNEVADPVAHTNFIDNYVSMAPLSGTKLAVDSAEVHTYIVNFIAGNNMAESKIQAHTDDNDGRRDFIALTAHY